MDYLGPYIVVGAFTFAVAFMDHKYERSWDRLWMSTVAALAWPLVVVVFICYGVWVFLKEI